MVHKLCVQNETDKATGVIEKALAAQRTVYAAHEYKPSMTMSNVWVYSRISHTSGPFDAQRAAWHSGELCLKSEFSDSSVHDATVSRPPFAH